MDRRTFLTLPLAAVTTQPKSKPFGWILVSHGGFMSFYEDKLEMEVSWHHKDMPGYKSVVTTEEYVKLMLKWYCNSYKEAFPVFK